MLLQIIYQSLDYFSYPIDIKVDVNYDIQKTFPSISLCTKRTSIMTKTQIREYYPHIYLKLLTLESKHDCDIFSEKYANDYNICYRKYERDLNEILKDIRNQNKNTTLEQLFEKTLHLNQLIDCQIHYKNGKVINCSQNENTIEYFDGFNFFGKCFIYFDEREKHENNRSENILNSDNAIVFKMDKTNLRQILGNNYMSYMEICDLPMYFGAHSRNNFLSNYIGIINFFMK